MTGRRVTGRQPTDQTWDADDPRDYGRIQTNVRDLLDELQTTATLRRLPDQAELARWHGLLYTGCRVPAPGYVGHYRGDREVPELTGYEVGIGLVQPDGLTEKVGVWSADLEVELDRVLRGLHAALRWLDDRMAIGRRPSTVEELQLVVELAALVHGEWIRLHPFANGNGRTARVWVAFVCLRYRVPLFLALKPRTPDLAYARAARDSMGRPPDFVGDHSTATAVFGHLLSLSLLPG